MADRTAPTETIRSATAAPVDPVIEVDDLHVDFGSTKAVAGISLEVRPREIFALLGTNGAGKTTTLDVVEGYRRATRGTVRVLGLDPAAHHDELAPRIGIMLQEAGFFETLTVMQAVRAWSRFFDHPRPAQEVLALAGLTHRARTRTGKLSGGERRRLDLALALLGRPELLFLDEPTTGMDPQGRRDTLALIESIVGNGTTVLMTTHYLPEAEQLADRVAIMHRGRIVCQGTLDEVRGSLGTATLRFSVAAESVDGMPLPVGAEVDRRGGLAGVVIHTSRPQEDLAEITAWAQREHLQLHHIEVAEASLEDVFLGLLDDPADPERAA